jgi:hypothetical protein
MGVAKIGAATRRRGGQPAATPRPRRSGAGHIEGLGRCHKPHPSPGPRDAINPSSLPGRSRRLGKTGEYQVGHVEHAPRVVGAYNAVSLLPKLRPSVAHRDPEPGPANHR